MKIANVGSLPLRIPFKRDSRSADAAWGLKTCPPQILYQGDNR
jgi:hypothetical protein